MLSLQYSWTKESTSTCMIIVTDRCNLDCNYCFFKRGISKQKISPEEMLEKVKHFQYVVFTGGEPLLNFDWIKRFVELAESKKVPFEKFMIFTNGTLIDAEKIDFFKKHNIDINISLDGPKFVNDANRVFPGGSGSFDKIINSIKLLNEEKYPFRLTAVLSHKSVPNLLDNLVFLSKLGENSLTLSVLFESKNLHIEPLSISELIASDKQIWNYQKLYFERKVRTKLVPLAIINPLVFESSKIRDEVVKISPCPSGLHNFTISVDGTVFPCPNGIGYDNTAYFNISEKSFFEAQNFIREKYSWLTETINKNFQTLSDVLLRCPLRTRNDSYFYEENLKTLRFLSEKFNNKLVDKFLKNKKLVKAYYSSFLGREVDFHEDSVKIGNKVYKALVLD